VGRPNRRREELRSLAHRSRELVGLAALVGVATGLGVALFDWITVEVALGRVLDLPVAIRPWVPLLGLALTAAALRAGGRLGPGTSDEYIRNFHEHDDLPLRPVPWRMVAAVATLGSGAPGGLEGPSMYLGAGIGTGVGRRFRSALGTAGTKSLMVAGAAAGVAAIFRAPATGAVFALEVPYRDDLGRRLLVPALVGAASGYLAFVAVAGTDPLLDVTGNAPFDLRDLLGAVGLGVVAGIVVRLYAWCLRAAKDFQTRLPTWVTVPVGGVAIALLAIAAHAATGESLGLTPGYNAIEWAARPDHGLWVVALILGIRLAGTVASLAGGGVIGLFVPLVVAGALLGRLAGGMIGATNPTLFVIIGVAAALGAGYRVPLAAVTFVAEASGRPGFVVPGLLAAVGADLVMGSSSVTRYQQSGASVDEYH
jgi:CIC family chloride channel protein